jgi:peptidoglycan/LPS O-acetylase OafA/YrhL
MPFVQFGWEIKNPETSPFLDRLVIWLHQWRLPLLFFVSGIGVNYSLSKRGLFSFYGERIVRLFIPLLFAMFFTIPLQVYYEWLQLGKINESYYHFYPSVWDMVPYPQGTLTWSHMWFVVYLFTFTLLLFPVFGLFKIDFIKSAKQKLDSLFKTMAGALAPCVVLILCYFKLYVHWPEQGSLLDDWFVFIFSITLYFLGFFLGDLKSFFETCQRYRKPFMFLAIACIGLQYFFFWEHLEWRKLQSQESIYLYGTLNGLLIWTTILAILGFAKQHLNFSTPLLKYATEAVYPFYILHQTVIVATGYYVTQWNLPIIVKLIILVVLCFVLVSQIYHWLIRPFIVTRILFGVRYRK